MHQLCEFPDALNSTLLVLRTWLQGESDHLRRGLLSSIRDFARSVSGSDTMRDVAQEIANLANEKVCVADYDS
jgi:hypothetical protein